uniref:Uncharacterized protein n=1 Tax=uncultured Aquificia bacterium TaxID=453415 RepID=H5SBW1_9BACT|nr:hypothetical protein HGMM_F07F09C22 [uncultured Aquificae bacterium]
MFYLVEFATYGKPEDLILEVAKELYKKHQDYYAVHSHKIEHLPSEVPTLTLTGAPGVFTALALHELRSGYSQVKLHDFIHVSDILEPEWVGDVSILWRWVTSRGNVFAIGWVGSSSYILWFGRRHAIVEHFPTLQEILHDKGYVVREYYHTRRPDLPPFTTTEEVAL